MNRVTITLKSPTSPAMSAGPTLTHMVTENYSTFVRSPVSPDTLAPSLYPGVVLTFCNCVFRDCKPPTSKFWRRDSSYFQLMEGRMINNTEDAQFVCQYHGQSHLAKISLSEHRQHLDEMIDRMWQTHLRKKHRSTMDLRITAGLVKVILIND